jgi:serine/threonine protein kinase
VLDRFQLRKELHVGSCGELWLARERDTRELYVARIGLGDASFKVRTEGEVLSRLQHPGIPRFVHQGELDGGWCTIVEYVEGATLGKVLRVAVPAAPRAASWARQLALALEHVHQMGVVHGDLHPDHVIVGRDEVGRDRLVVVGFGEATPTGTPRGRAPSPQVAAPELLQGAMASPEADLYAIGAILYRMLADRWPFSGSEPQVLEDHVFTPPPPLGRHLPALRLPPGLEALVFRCLAKDPAERVGSAQELADALGAVEFAPQRDWVPVAGTEPPAGEAQISLSSRSRSRSRSGRAPRMRTPEPAPAPLWALGGVLLMILMMGWYFAW